MTHPDETYRQLRDGLHRFIEQFGAGAPKAGGGRRAPDTMARRWHQLLVDHGFLGRSVPKEYGGFGAVADANEDAIISDALADADLSAGIRDVGTGLIVPTLLELGTEEQRRRFVGPSLRAEVIWCQGFSEPEAGSDLASLRTRAVGEGPNWRINGRKIWTTSAQYADMMVLLCRTEDAPGPAGLSCLLLPMTTRGLTVLPIRTMTGKASFNEVVLDDVLLPIDACLGGVGEGWRVAATLLKYERGMLGSADKASGRLRRLSQMMRNRMLNGVPVIDLPALHNRLLCLEAEALAVKCHNMRMIAESDRDQSGGVGGLISKYLGAGLALKISTLATDVMALDGLAYDPREGDDEDDTTSWLADYVYDLGLTIGGGSAQIQKNIIAERGLGLPREPKVQRHP